MEENKVILVDEFDKEIGYCEKIEAHKKGFLHRAFSIFIFNSDGKLLLQQRAVRKYHSGGLWTNTVCSHPKPGEDLKDATKRRLIEEMGFSTDLIKIFSLVYKSQYENGLTEYEFDHIFMGFYNHDPKPNKEEVETYKWEYINEIRKDIIKNSNNYTTWFKKILETERFICIGENLNNKELTTISL